VIVNTLGLAQTDDQLDGTLTRTPVAGKNIAHDLATTCLDDDAAAHARAIARDTDQLDAHPVGRREAIQKQAQRPTADRAHQQVGCTVAVEVGSDHRARVRVDVGGGGKRRIEELFAADIQKQSIALVRTEVVAAGGDIERVLDPELATLAIDRTQLRQLCIAVQGL
jgi:hypothetical protein